MNQFLLRGLPRQKFIVAGRGTDKSIFDKCPVKEISKTALGEQVFAREKKHAGSGRR
jgi:hypothetical protein